MVLNSLLLYIKDVQQTVSFYTKLGFEATDVNVDRCILSLGDMALQCFDEAKVNFKLKDPNVKKGEGVYFYLRVDDVDVFYAELLEKGIKPATEPKNWEWGNREFVVKDPDGYKWVIYKPTS